MKLRSALIGAALIIGLACLAALPAAEAQAPPAVGGDDAFDVDPVHSTIIFGISHMGVGYFYGRFNSPYGTFYIDPDEPSKSSFDITVDTDNVDTHNGRRDGHLKSADFFNAREFPKITFKSTEVKNAGKDKYRVTGELSIHGVTKPVTVEIEHLGTAEVEGRGRMAGFRTGFTLSRSDYGVDYMPGALGDEVTLLIGVEGKGK